MSKTFEESLHVQKVILGLLIEKGPLRWYQLEKETVKRSPTSTRFQTCFNWLKKNGYIAKSGESWRAQFEITDKGKAYYGVLP